MEINSSQAIRQILDECKTIAVVGLSSNLMRPSNNVSEYMQRQGYRIIPVNPHETEVLGEKAYATLRDVPEPVEIVEVFRPAEEAPEIARAAVEIGAKALWLQLGITSAEAARIAEEGGLRYVENQCMGVQRARFHITKQRQVAADRTESE